MGAVSYAPAMLAAAIMAVSPIEAVGQTSQVGNAASSLSVTAGLRASHRTEGDAELGGKSTEFVILVVLASIVGGMCLIYDFDTELCDKDGPTSP